MPNATITVDTSTTKPLGPGAVGIGISTYGSSIVKSQAQADALAKHGPRYYRLPIQWNSGNPVSSARGGPGDISADEWVEKIQGIGGVVFMQIGGKDTDMDFSPEDAKQLVKRYAPRGVTLFGVGNEPNNLGWDMNRYVDLYNAVTPAMRQGSSEVGVAIQIAGPVWSYYDRGRNQDFLSRANDVDILEYHHYAMGNPPALSDEDTLSQTPDWGQECREIREDAASRGKPDVIPLVGEANWAWQYRDGYSGTGDGADTRFFQPIITAWMASIIGHGLENGGWVWQYSDQNGPLGITVEPGNTDQGKPGNSPQPVYHGVGAWSGEGLFPGVSDTMYQATGQGDNIEAWAVKNLEGGVNVIVVNKSTSNDATVDVVLDDDIEGVDYRVFTSGDDGYAFLSERSSGTASGVPVQVSVRRTGVAVITTTSVPSGPVTPPEPAEPVSVKWVTGPSSTPGGTDLRLDGRSGRINAGRQIGQWQASEGVVEGGSVADRPALSTEFLLGDGEVVTGIYDDEVWGQQTWSIDVPADTAGVALDLLFMERYEGSQTRGGRLFNIEATYGDAHLQAADVDVFGSFGTEAGGIVCVLAPTLPTNKATLTLSPGSTGDNPFINAVRIRLLERTTTTPPPDGGDDGLFDHLPPSASLDDVINKVNDLLDYLKPA